MAQGEENGVGQRQVPPGLSSLLARFPFLKRHPHPALAHFPIVYLLSAGFFSVLYLLTGDLSFDATAFYCLAAGLLFLPPTILTGLFTHWLNFPGELHRTMGLERRLSLLLLTVAAGACAWRWADPGVLTDPGGLRLVYLLLVLALTPLVTATSYFGGMLSFPLGAPPPAIWFPKNPGRRPAPPG